MSLDWPMCGPLQTMVFLGRNVSMHPVALPALELVARRLERTQYGAFIRAKHLAGDALSGGFACRPRSEFQLDDGTFPPLTDENHSEHAHGAACDFNFGPSNPLRTDGFLTCDYARFGREDGKAVMRAWLEPPPGLPFLFRWGGIGTTDPDVAAAVLPEPPTFTRHVGGSHADAHHFDLLELSLEQLERFDWTGVMAMEEDEDMALSEEAKAVIVAAQAAAQAAQAAAEAARGAAEAAQAAAELAKSEGELAKVEARKGRQWQDGYQTGLIRPDEVEPDDPDRAGGFRTAIALRRLFEP